MSTAAVRRYWSRLVQNGCWICGRPAQIAHAHSGSVRERMQEPKAKGKKLARLDWLCLPLCPDHHSELDANVAAWEVEHMPQAQIIDRLGLMHSLDLWALAKQGKK